MVLLVDHITEGQAYRSFCIMSAGKAAGAVMAIGGAALVFMQLNKPADPVAEKEMPEHVKRSPLKKTLSQAGLYPEPVKDKSRLQKMPSSGSMAVFNSGKASDALTKGGGEAL